MSKIRLDRIGEENENSFGSLMTIINYYSASNIDIYFPEYDWTFYHSSYKDFEKGNVKCPYEPRYYGIGYLGEGKYKASVKGKEPRSIITWQGMLQRCYSEYSLINHPTYDECFVCNEWLNYQNFAEWYENNYYECSDGERMTLDKDILIKGNKIYSPETCVFTPIKINNLFTKCNKTRGELPIGVTIYKNKFIAQCHDGYGNNKKLGRFDNVEQAFKAYKEFKETVIKNIAEEYKNEIPYILYDALCNYKVEMYD
jgi:hypothetical protein